MTQAHKCPTYDVTYSLPSVAERLHVRTVTIPPIVDATVIIARFPEMDLLLEWKPFSAFKAVVDPTRTNWDVDRAAFEIRRPAIPGFLVSRNPTLNVQTCCGHDVAQAV